MNIETLEVAGIWSALEAMRNPMDSWKKSDSVMKMDCNNQDILIGENDAALSVKLQKAGPAHSKHLRLIQVWANIAAPRYWWMEFDTHRMGVEKVSCSTMHKLMARPLTVDDFEHDDLELPLGSIVRAINARMENYKTLKDDGCLLEAKEVWREIIQLLPQSYIQKRTVMMSYAAIRNMIELRTGHKLAEWAFFISWCKTLPHAATFLFDDE